MRAARTIPATIRPAAVAAMLAVGASLFLATASFAATLSFTSVPASNAAAEMSRRYGVSIVFRGTVNGNQPVTFSVDNADTPDGRLQAVNGLANALNLDFQKVFVVSKVDPGASVPEVKIDNNALVVFPATKVPAREAIQTVAGVDDALAQISGAVSGTVIFPQRRMTAAAAAAAIAKQTGTVWRAYYGLFPRGQRPTRLEGDVIDHDINGQPITASPLVTFRIPASRPVPITTLTPGGAVAGVGNGDLGQGPDVATVPNTGSGPFTDYSFDPYGYGSPYGYGNPYGVDPYGYGGFGYAAPNGGVAYPGSVYTPGAGSEPVVPGVNAPGYFPPGTTVTTVPTTNNTVLPDFPFSGAAGGSVTVGGY